VLRFVGHMHLRGGEAGGVLTLVLRAVELGASGLVLYGA
jgi:hypothetical protein